jgi:hypothetical protein
VCVRDALHIALPKFGLEDLDGVAIFLGFGGA